MAFIELLKLLLKWTPTAILVYIITDLQEKDLFVAFVLAFISDVITKYIHLNNKMITYLMVLAMLGAFVWAFYFQPQQIQTNFDDEQIDTTLDEEVDKTYTTIEAINSSMKEGQTGSMATDNQVPMDLEQD